MARYSLLIFVCVKSILNVIDGSNKQHMGCLQTGAKYKH